VLSDCRFREFIDEMGARSADFFSSDGLPLDKYNSKAIYLGANVRGFLY
jgi:hypothetical protein